MGKRHDAELDVIRRTGERHDAELDEIRHMGKRFDGYIYKNDQKVGDIGNSIGALIEDIAYPSIENIVRKQCNAKFMGEMNNNIPGKELQIDAWGIRGGYSKSSEEPEIFIFEIKTRFRDGKTIEQIQKHIVTLRRNEPQYRTCPIYPFLVVAKITADQELLVWNSGIHLIKFREQLFDLEPAPKGFNHNYLYGVKKSSSSMPQRGVPTPYPPFYEQQLKRTYGSFEELLIH